jgi:hypothetical protein
VAVADGATVGVGEEAGAVPAQALINKDKAVTINQ